MSRVPFGRLALSLHSCIMWVEYDRPCGVGVCMFLAGWWSVGWATHNAMRFMSGVATHTDCLLTQTPWCGEPMSCMCSWVEAKEVARSRTKS